MRQNDALPPPPNDAQIAAQELRRMQDREKALRQQHEPVTDVRLPSSTALTPPTQPALSHLLDNETPCFTVKQLKLQIIASDKALPSDFDWVLDAAESADHVDSPIDRCLGAQSVGLLIKRMQDAIIERGYVTTRVLTGPQNIKSGDLVFTIIPGRIHAIRFAADSGTPLIRGTAWAAIPSRPGDLLHLRDIEQALENFKRVPTAEADIQVESVLTDGLSIEQPGQSDLVISYKQTLPFRVSLSLDDSGSQATGRLQASLTLSYDNALTLNDLFYVSLSHDLGSNHGGSSEHGTQGHTANYSVPLGYWLLGATASDNRYRQAVAGANQTYIYSGTSSNLDIKLSRVIYRDATRKTTFGLSAFRRNSSNYIDDTEIGVQRRVVGGFEASVKHRESLAFLDQATLDLSFAYKRGTGAFSSLRAPEEDFGEGTSRMRLTTMDATLNAPLKVWGQSIRYSGTVRGQYNLSALTPQDRFAIGGRYTVRGFDGESSLSAERGWLFRNELSTALGNTGQEAYVGLDYGRVSGAASDLLVGKSLMGAAIGLRGTLKNFQYDFYVGAPVKRPELFQTARVTTGFSLNYSF